jgi:hypothetical protein
VFEQIVEDNKSNHFTNLYDRQFAGDGMFAYDYENDVMERVLEQIDRVLWQWAKFGKLLASEYVRFWRLIIIILVFSVISVPADLDRLSMKRLHRITIITVGRSKNAIIMFVR